MAPPADGWTEYGLELRRATRSEPELRASTRRPGSQLRAKRWRGQRSTGVRTCSVAGGATAHGWTHTPTDLHVHTPKRPPTEILDGKDGGAVLVIPIAATPGPSCRSSWCPRGRAGSGELLGLGTAPRDRELGGQVPRPPADSFRSDVLDHQPRGLWGQQVRSAGLSRPHCLCHVTSVLPWTCSCIMFGDCRSPKHPGVGGWLWPFWGGGCR